MAHSHKIEKEKSGSKGETEYEIEKITDHRRMNTRGRPKYEYLIKWKNYSTVDNTWETKENIFSRELIDAYWEQQKEKGKGKKKSSTLDKDNDIISNTTTGSGSKHKRHKSAQNDKDGSNPGSTNSNSKVDQERDVDPNNEQAKEEAPVTAKVNIVKPPKGYQWTDGEVISAVILDTGDILAKIAWPNGEAAYRICR